MSDDLVNAIDGLFCYYLIFTVTFRKAPLPRAQIRLADNMVPT